MIDNNMGFLSDQADKIIAMAKKVGPQWRTEAVPDRRHVHPEAGGFQHPADPSHVSAG
jgi:hypothetical protein